MSAYAPFFVASFMVAAMTLKYIAATTSLRWVVLHGSGYQRKLVSGTGGPLTYEQYWGLLEATGGRTFPFGVRQFRLNRYWRTHAQAGPLVRRLPGLAVRLIDTSFNFAAMSVACTATLVWLSALDPTRYAWDAPVRYIGLALAIQMVAYPITIAAELVCAYARIGSYSGAFYRPLRYLRERHGGQLISEMQVFGFMLVTAYAMNTSVLAFAGRVWGAFNAIPLMSTDGGSLLEHLGNALYAAFYTMLAESDAGPRDAVGKALTALIAIQGCSLVLVALAALASLPNLTPIIQALTDHEQSEPVGESHARPDVSGIRESSPVPPDRTRPPVRSKLVGTVAVSAVSVVAVAVMIRVLTRDGRRQ